MIFLWLLWPLWFFFFLWFFLGCVVCYLYYLFMLEVLDYLFRSVLLKFQTLVTDHLSFCCISASVPLWSRTRSVWFQPSYCGELVLWHAPLGGRPRTVWGASLSHSSCGHRGRVGWRHFTSFRFFCLLVSHWRRVLKPCPLGCPRLPSLLPVLGSRPWRSMRFGTLTGACRYEVPSSCLQHSVSWWDGEPSSVHGALGWPWQTRKHSGRQSVF